MKERKNLGWDEIDEMVEWLNPEKDGKKRDSLARYLHYSQNGVLRGFFGLPCLLCHDHAVRINSLIEDREAFGWDVEDQNYDLVNNSRQFFEDHLLPSNFCVSTPQRRFDRVFVDF